jgi:geranylgeranyl reductase family protein
MERCDVVVVGGGPAGSSLAWGLRDSGLDVLLLDRASFPRDKTCAGWVTPQILADLAIDPAEYAKDRVLQPIRGFRVRRIGDRDALARWPQPVSYGIRRCEFDHYLLGRCGARTRLGEPFRSAERRGERWLVNGSIDAGLVVGAGGHFCPVARKLLGAKSEAERIVAAQEVEYLLEPGDRDDCPVDAEVPELYFTRDLRGYGWVLRKGDYLNVGLGRQDRHRLSDHLREFVRYLREIGKLPRHVSDDFHGHAYLLYPEAPRTLAGDGVLLVGDAAGLAYARSGEGIRPAVESGLLAARVIAAAGRRWDREALAAYPRLLAARLGPRRAGIGLTDLLPAALARRAAGFLLSQSWFARRVVVERWFLHAAQPALRAGAA